MRVRQVPGRICPTQALTGAFMAAAPPGPWVPMFGQWWLVLLRECELTERE
jgi:hypothetical protein